jgi:osmotically-inducible protein OsmY
VQTRRVDGLILTEREAGCAFRVACRWHGARSSAERRSPMKKTMLAVLLAGLLAPAHVVWGTDAATEPDNTGRNVRDRNDATQTPGDQGSSATDIKITQEIRRALTDSERLSTNGKNVKIITLDRVVTLRGPVDSQAERDAIVKVAKATDGVQRVDNQLEVAH